jgi:DNA replication and repair protein RecF
VLERLEIEGLRNVAGIGFDLGPGWNGIVGRNGAGKTTILEAVHLLTTAKSFRGGKNADLVRAGMEGLVVRGRVRGASGAEWVVVSKSPVGTRIRVDGKPVHTSSALAVRLPLVLITQESLDILYGGPEGRRRLLDRTVFHVEQEQYLPAWKNYTRILKQRNATLLAQGPERELALWDQELLAYAEPLEQCRRRVAERLAVALSGRGSALGMPGICLEYLQGWPQGQSLAAALHANRQADRSLRYTRIGPHRADLEILLDGRSVKTALSRGEVKRLTVALLLAQVEVLTGPDRERPLVLLDDLAAELDAEATAAVLDLLGEMGGQILATATTKSALMAPPGMEGRWFHVEQGCLTRA